MTFDEIEDVLGVSVVQRIEAAISEAYAIADKCGDQNIGAVAVETLLLYFVAAAIMTAPDGALEKARERGKLLNEIVEHSLLLGKGSTPPKAPN
jgi:hypothetical protein